MNRILERILSLLPCTLAVLLIALGLLGKGAGGRAAQIPGARNMSEHTILYSNGDKVYTPPKENLSYDEASCTIYYNNLLNVYLWSEISDREKERLAGDVGGIVAGDISGLLNVLQILVEPRDLAGLQQQAALLMESELVLYASYEFPVEIEPDSLVPADNQNPWEGEVERGNEDNPSGNDWWAEAIGAYRAWQYGDEIEMPVMAGVMDNGFHVNHEEFTDETGKCKISFPEDYGENVLELDTDKAEVPSINSHGTHVAGILAASNNGAGIRGVADQSELVCVDFNNGNQGTNILSSGVYIEATKQILEEGAKVINNSWGTAIRSRVMFLSDLVEYEKPDPLKDLRWGAQWLGDLFTKDYEEYYNRMTGSYSLSTSSTCMAMMIQLLCQEREDFLIVQAAGNGYDNGGTGYDVLLGNFYVAVTREHYEGFLQPGTMELLEKRGIIFDTLRQHILIVGAVEKERDSQGRYLLCDFSNYGSNVDLVAPGRGILSCFADHPGAYGEFDGTSQAAPMVSGAAALVWSVNPRLSAAQVRQTLLDTAGLAVGVTDGDAGREYRMLNVGNAVERAVWEKKEAGNDRGEEQEAEGSTGEETLEPGNGQGAGGIRENWTEPEIVTELEENFQTDTSEGTYEMATKMEYRGKLYYFEDSNVMRCNLDGSGIELFYGLEEGEYGNRGFLATDQYIYVFSSPDLLTKIRQFTEDGVKVGYLEGLGGDVCFHNGYFYDMAGYSLFRRKAEVGSSTELVKEISRLQTTGPMADYKIYNGYVYVKEGQDLLRISVDGIYSENISGLWGAREDYESYFDEMINGVFYNDSIYFWMNRKEDWKVVLCRAGLDGGMETVLASTDQIYYEDWQWGQADHLLVTSKVVYFEPGSDSVIETYNMDTGEVRTVFHEGEREKESFWGTELERCEYTLLFLPGASRIYYQMKGWEAGTTSWDLYGCSIDTEGGSRAVYEGNIWL